jgi:hypothetical protein
MGVEEGPPLLRLSGNDSSTHRLVDVRNSFEDKFPKDGPPPFLSFHVSMFLVPALRRVDAWKPMLITLPF